MMTEAVGGLEEERALGPHGPVRTARCRISMMNSRVIGEISAKCCSFSAVSAPIFARKYAFCSIFQNLPDYQAEIFEIKQAPVPAALAAGLKLVEIKF